MALAIFAAPMGGVVIPTPLPHNSPFPGENFGIDVARCDGLTFIGRQFDASAGSVAVFRGTTLVDEIFYPGVQMNARFGHSLDVTPDCSRLVVGAPSDNGRGTASGMLYYFDRVGTDDAYEYGGALYGDDTTTGDELGQSVAVSPSGNTIAGGAYVNKTYAFWESGVNWTHLKLTFSDVQPDGLAGYALTFIGNLWLFVTAPLDYDTNPPLWEGSFYLFDRYSGGSNNWGQKFKGHVNGAFKLGWDVSASGRRVALGAPGNTGFPGDDASGDVYTIIINPDGGGWTLEQHLTAPSPQADAEFGASVSLSANQLVVGEPWRDIGGISNHGTWYSFLRESSSSWALHAEIRPSNSEANARNGWSSDIYGGWFAGGSPFSDEDGTDAGAGYVHTFDFVFSDGFELGDTGIWSASAP